MPRYVIAHCDREVGAGWGHIFTEDGREVERDTRFVYDRDAGRLVHLDILRGNKWREASRAEIEDLEDSLKNANEDALENPADWDLDETDDLPEWAGAGEPAPEP